MIIAVIVVMMIHFHNDLHWYMVIGDFHINFHDDFHNDFHDDYHKDFTMISTMMAECCFAGVSSDRRYEARLTVPSHASLNLQIDDDDDDDDDDDEFFSEKDFCC